MKILIIGSGGREHALANAYAKSKKVSRVFVAPGNKFMDIQNQKISSVSSIGLFEIYKLVSFAKKEKIDLVDVAQDEVLAKGFVDKFTKEGFTTFGATQKASQIEWDKDWARTFMQKYKLPIPTYASFSDTKKAIAYVEKNSEKLLFIKASGLALGKGVIRADTKQEAKTAVLSMQQFGKSGETFLIEEGLVGEEFSFFAICDGENFVVTKAAQDHKTVFEGDTGPNTGGMGCVAPASVVNTKIEKEVVGKIIKPFIKGMQREGRPYSGILYLGGMLTSKGVKIIEFNARWGDPEAEVILSSIQTDYLSIIEAVLEKKLAKKKIMFDNNVRISIAGCARGYPIDYSAVKGKEIFGLLDASKLPGISIYGAGISMKDNRCFVNGGRIFHLVAEGATITQARFRAYAAMSIIYIEGNNLHYRTDIGWREVERLEKSV